MQAISTHLLRMYPASEMYITQSINKGRSPSNGKLSDFSFYIDSQISAHWKFKKIDQLII